MTDKDEKRRFIEGFREGLNIAFSEVEKMLSRGFTSTELKMMIGSKKTTLYKELDRKMKELGLEEGGEARVTSRPELPPLSPGDSIIFIEKSPQSSIDLFDELTQDGTNGLAIIRMNPNKFVEMISGPNVKMKWLATASKSGKKKTRSAPLGLAMSIDEYDGEINSDDLYLKPTELTGIDVEITRYLSENENGIILLTGIEYLITQNEFSKILKMIQTIQEKVVLYEGYLILSIDADSMEKKELNLIEKEMSVVLSPGGN